MISFFRKVKRKLLKERKVSSYLAYAIGEIILVVLGILIAIQINQVNTTRVDRQQEYNYLEAISANLKEDITELQLRLGKDSVHLTAQTNLVRAFTNDSIRANEDLLKYSMHNSAIISYFNPQNTAFEDMRFSGNLGLIDEDSLRYQILEYYNHSQRVVSSQEINNELFLKYKDRALDQKLDMNSLIDAQLPEEWQTEISPFDNSFFGSDRSLDQQEDFARNISLMKASVWINHNWKKALLKEAEAVRMAIEMYLSDHPGAD